MSERGGNANAAAGAAGAIYGFGFIGALVYFIQTATSFWDGVWGVIQALFWPGFLVWGLFHFIRF